MTAGIRDVAMSRISVRKICDMGRKWTGTVLAAVLGRKVWNYPCTFLPLFTFSTNRFSYHTVLETSIKWHEVSNIAGQSPVQPKLKFRCSNEQVRTV